MISLRWGHILVLALIFSLLLAIHCEDVEDEDLELEDLDFEEYASGDGSAGNVAAARARNLLVDLSDHTAKRIISSHEYTLLLGYASWCTRSSELMPEFAAAAAVFEGKVLFAKLDAIANPKTAAAYNIKGYPTVLFFTNGSREQVYPGGDTKEEIVNWIRKRTGTPTSTVSSKEEAEAFLKHTPVFVGGFFSKFEGHEYDTFVEAAKLEIGTDFIQTMDLGIAKVFSSNIETAPLVWVRKNEPEHFVAFDGKYTTEELLHFIELNKYPLVVKLTTKNIAKINYSPLKLQVLLFVDDTDIKSLLALYQEAALKYKGKILFVLVNYSDVDLAMPYLSMYGVQPGKPIVAAFNYENGQKYLLDKDINLESLTLFCDGLVIGELPQHYRSEPVPTKEKGHIQIVVGKTFEDIVLDESKDVFLQVTSPWCAVCEAANKTVEKLATVLKDIPSLIIAQIDGSANEHPKLEVNTFPSFLFYPAGQKSKPIIGPSKTNAKGLVQFIKKHAAIPFTIEHSFKPAVDEQKTNVKDEL